MTSTDREIYEELRRERLWQLIKRTALGIVYAAVGILLIGLVSAATVGFMDQSVGPFSAPFSVSDDE